ncbi:hypothetical protein CGLO_13611 [Colletotrichum gloeosporioides Cg-14]|uniref:Uncharacterized protein n=1 Tax=Colletotrichum gloeosporioides (strain Cg-14) TaxID=1237896 RepID=T0K5S7_COLGC|nr:hypothetical protein CGLO_13611 [Colletotrichum gloeosporioides Cg-14]
MARDMFAMLKENKDGNAGTNEDK